MSLINTTDTRSLRQLARDAIDVQNACNLTGVVDGFSRSVSRLRALHPGEGTAFFNTHPIVVLWVDKLASLTNTQNLGCNVVMRAYDVVQKLRDGECPDEPSTPHVYTCGSAYCPEHGDRNRDLGGAG